MARRGDLGLDVASNHAFSRCSPDFDNLTENACRAPHNSASDTSSPVGDAETSVPSDAARVKGAEPQVLLRILATTDLHGEILSYDYYRNRPHYGQGLAQVAHLIERARAEVPGSLLLDNGDFLQGSALAQHAALQKRRRAPHPAIAAFNALGYDAVGLGNREFNYGLALLKEALADARFPVVSSNVIVPDASGDRDRERYLVEPYALLKRQLCDQSGTPHEVTIGVFGLTPPQILQWDRRHLEGRVHVRSMVQTARAVVPEIRAAGADVVVCLAHTGIAAGRVAAVSTLSTRGNGRSSRAMSEEEAIEIAAIPGIDAVIAGHSHLVFPREGTHPDPRVDQPRGLVLGKPCVLPGHSGSHLGQIDLRLEKTDAGWSVRGASAQAISTSEVLASLDVASIRKTANPLRRALTGQHRATLQWLRREIAVTKVPLSTHFAHLVDSQATRMIAAALTAHVQRKLGDGPYAKLPVLASVSPFRTGGRGGPLNYTDIPVGKLSVRAIYDLYPFPNRVVAHLVSGADLRQRLELGTAVFNRLIPGRTDQPLLDPSVPGFSYDIISGLTYDIDLAQPYMAGRRNGSASLTGSRGRITHLSHEGRPVEPDDQFILVTNSFAQDSGSAPRLPVVLDDRRLCGDVIARWAEKLGVVELQHGPGWRLAPMPGTSVLMQGGAGALNHIGEIAAYRPEFLGLTAEGFQSFRLHL